MGSGVFVVLLFMSGIVFFFFKQKTAYEMRISDWSSDVCSSDLRLGLLHADHRIVVAAHAGIGLVRRAAGQDLRIGGRHMAVGAADQRGAAVAEKIGRAHV